MHDTTARARFPRGLRQPAQGYRFSLDSLLLASFAGESLGEGASLGADLGTGCGVVALAMLLGGGEPLRMVGVEQQRELAACARENAILLGFDERFEVISGDISSYRDSENRFDFAVANPPYRRGGQGRMNPEPGRAAARFEQEGALRTFCSAATRLLCDRAPFFVVHLPERLEDLFAALGAATLVPKRLTFVHSRADESARMVLLEARKNGGRGLAVGPPLVLYAGRGERTRMTADALAFCPHLQCNAAQGGSKT